MLTILFAPPPLSIDPRLTETARVDPSQTRRTRFPRLQAIADTLSGARKVVVITGAGISTTAGIPVGRKPTLLA